MSRINFRNLPQNDRFMPEGKNHLQTPVGVVESAMAVAFIPDLYSWGREARVRLIEVDGLPRRNVLASVRRASAPYPTPRAVRDVLKNIAAGTKTGYLMADHDRSTNGHGTAAEERLEPLLLDHPAAATRRDRDLDRTPPPPAESRPRSGSVDAGQASQHHKNIRPGSVTGNCLCHEGQTHEED
jgi:hypothetical protein